MAPKRKYPIRSAGFKFGDWVVIEYQCDRHPSYICECKPCGSIKPVDQYNLERGRTKSCIPCANARLRTEQNGVYIRFQKYGREHVDRLANRYYAILSRCRGKGYGASRYYGRGIKSEFLDVYDFIGYCLTLDGWDQPELEIDRINNDGNYVKGNLRFVTHQTNLRNRSL